MTARLIIRPAGPADIDEMVALLRVLFCIEADFDFDEKRQRQGLRLLLEQDSACVLVAEIDHRVIGMCSGQATISTAEGGAAILVEDVVVSETYRRQNIGRQLMAALEHWTKEKGIKRLQLLADRTNANGLEFYRKLGWYPTRLTCMRKFT